jgi:hypothetical protein
MEDSMSWKWDRPSSAEVVINGEDAVEKALRRTSMGYWREEDRRYLEAMRSNADVINLVQRRIKKSIGRTPDMRVTGADGHSTGHRLAFGLTHGKAELVHIWEGDESRLTGEGASLASIVIGSNSQHSVLWLYRAAYVALGRADRGHAAVIKLHS